MTDRSQLRGVMPVAPTVFDDDEALDLDGMGRVVDYLVAADVDAICILANYSEQFSLDDGERVAIIEASMARAAGRVPVAVTTSHFSARVAAARTRDACQRGASIAMLMAPFFGTSVRATEEGVVEYFKRVAGDLEIDLMIQDAPMSATPLPVAPLTRIAREVPQVRYVKVEVPQAAGKLRALAAAAGESLPGSGRDDGVGRAHRDAGGVAAVGRALVAQGGVDDESVVSGADGAVGAFGLARGAGNALAGDDGGGHGLLLGWIRTGLRPARRRLVRGRRPPERGRVLVRGRVCAIPRSRAGDPRRRSRHACGPLAGWATG